MRNLTEHLRNALRSLRRSPGSTALAVAVLALGLGAFAAVLRVGDALLLRPLPFRDPSRLASLSESDARRQIERNVASPSDLMAWRERSRSFEALAGHAPWESNLTGSGAPERVPIGAVSANFFDVLGVAPLLGRTLRPSDGVPGAPAVVVVGRAFWRSHLGGDPAAVGRPIVLGGQPATVVGVVPDTTVLPPRARLFVPLTESEGFRGSTGRWLAVVGRLRPGVTLESARAEMNAIAGRLAEERPRSNAGWGVTTSGLADDLRRDARPALLALLAGAGLLLLIACVNVGCLLLSRSLARDGDRAVRVALGASVSRLLVPEAFEALLLAIGGWAAGLLVAEALVSPLIEALPAGLADLVPAGADARSLLLSLGTALVAGLAVSIAPLVRAAGRSGLDLRGGSGRASGDCGARRASRLLVLVELSVSALLLIGAGLVVRSFVRLASVDPGFRSGGVLAFRVALSRTAYPDDASQARFHERAVEALRAMPGAAAAAGISWRPLLGGAATNFSPLDRPEPLAGNAPVADIRIVTPDLFHVLGVPLLSGRTFGPEDRADRPVVAVVNAALARSLWPKGDPIGQRLRVSWGPPERQEVTIVGVAGDVHLADLGTAPRAAIYFASSQVPNSFMTFVVRSESSGDSGLAALAAAARGAMGRLDPDLPLADLGPLASSVHDSISRPRRVATFSGLFAGTALLLTAVGLFGVVSHVVGRRRRELGVRAALGARPDDLSRLVLGESLALAATAAGLGLLASRVAGHLLADLLFDTRPDDPLVAVCAAALVLVVSLAASAVPARRAARLDPALALRSE